MGSWINLVQSWEGHTLCTNWIIDIYVEFLKNESFIFCRVGAYGALIHTLAVEISSMYKTNNFYITVPEKLLSVLLKSYLLWYILHDIYLQFSTTCLGFQINSATLACAIAFTSGTTTTLGSATGSVSGIHFYPKIDTSVYTCSSSGSGNLQFHETFHIISL